MSEETDIEKCNFQKFHDLELDLGSGHTTRRRASVIDLYLHTKYFVEIGKNFCGLTYGLFPL